MMKKPEKTKFQWQWWWSSFSNPISKSLLLLGFIIFSPAAFAVDITAVYFSACMRETGVVINVDENNLQLMTLKGEIRSIPRFNIIYIASYPVGHITIPEVTNPEASNIVTVRTLYRDSVVDMVKGWMIDYSEDQISFLTLAGTQTVIDTADIWDLEISPLHEVTRFEKRESGQYEFAHPYPFMHCQKELSGNPQSQKKLHKIYPQYLLPDPLMIKRDLDRLKAGYDRIRKYNSAKRFYAVPQVYTNETSLGIWANLGSRYGSSRNRSNSFIPAITSELTEGPFGFQRVLITGAAPMNYGIHDEPQVQAYYRLKASYVHFSIMVDINRFNMGSEKYKWSPEDMETNDNRENEIFHLAGGFDYGSFAIDLSMVNFMYYAIRHGSYFYRGDMNLNKGGLFYHNRFLRLELYHAFATDSKDPPIPLPDDPAVGEKERIEAINADLAAKPEFDTQFLFYRLNLELFTLGKIRPVYSLIYKGLDFTREQDGQGLGAFKYSSQSLTNTLYVHYPLDDDLKLSGYFSLESLDNQYGELSRHNRSSNLYPKGGLSLALLF